MTLAAECFESLFEIDSTVVLVGDFNVPSINWSANDDILFRHCNSIDNVYNCETEFLKFIQRQSLRQLVVDPTRSKNILDLVFCNDPLAIFSVNVSEPFSSSDHNSVCFSILSDSCDNNNSNIDYYDYKSAEWEKLRQVLAEHDWKQVFSYVEGEEIWSSFHSVLSVYIDRFVPKKQIRSTSKKKFFSCLNLESKTRAWSKRPW